MENEISKDEINARIIALQDQRNNALDLIAVWQGKYQILKMQNTELQKQLDEIKKD